MIKLYCCGIVVTFIYLSLCISIREGLLKELIIQSMLSWFRILYDVMIIIVVLILNVTKNKHHSKYWYVYLECFKDKPSGHKNIKERALNEYCIRKLKFKNRQPYSKHNYELKRRFNRRYL